MKVIYITFNMPYWYPEAFLIQEAQSLISSGHELLIVPTRPRGSVLHDDAMALLAHTIKRPLVSIDILSAAFLESISHPLKMLRCFRLVLGSTSIGVLRDNLAVFPKGLWLGRLARKLGAHHIHAHWGAATSTMGLIASEMSGVPWSLTFHRYDIIEKQNLIKQKLASAAFARFISKSGLEMIKTLGIGALINKCRVLHLGVNLPDREKIQPVECKVHKRIPILLCPANLTLVKGHKYLIDACKILSDEGMGFKLWLAGKGELRSNLEFQISRLSIADKVHFLGELPHSKLLELYSTRAVDVVILPSSNLGHGCHEGIPVSLIEAMSCAIPVISTCTGGIPELLDGGAGLMVSEKDSDALADAIKQIICDIDTRNRLMAAGRKRVEEEFDVKTIAQELTLLFEQSV